MVRLTQSTSSARRRSHCSSTDSRPPLHDLEHCDGAGNRIFEMLAAGFFELILHEIDENIVLNGLDGRVGTDNLRFRPFGIDPSYKQVPSLVLG